MKKVYPSAAAALRGIVRGGQIPVLAGSTVHLGGYGRPGAGAEAKRVQAQPLMRSRSLRRSGSVSFRLGTSSYSSRISSSPGPRFSSRPSSPTKTAATQSTSSIPTKPVKAST